MRPAGGTNHLGRMLIPDIPIANNDDFERSIELIDAALEGAVERVMDAKPNAFILGISALSVWGGTPAWGDELKARIRRVAGWDIPVAIATNALVAALRAHGVKHRIAVMEPYFPSIEPGMQGMFGPFGYEIVRYKHMRGKSPTSYSILSAQDMIQGMRAIDGADIEAIVQFGANLPMARLADEAERWLDKPVISVNVATYWHALRMNGITDKLYGLTQLMSRF